MVETAERRAFYGQRRLAIGGGDSRTHPSEWLYHTLHRPAAEGGVRDERARDSTACERPGENAHRGARVLAVDGAVRRSPSLEPAAPAPPDLPARIELASELAQPLRRGPHTLAVRQ